MWQSRQFHLSPKDHWEVKGMLDYLDEWNRLSSVSILAIFGPTTDRDTWVTEFSLDMIQAFQVQDVLVTFALCDRPEEQVFTPTTVIKTLVCQLFEQNPGLILEAPEVLNSRVFRKINDFDQACVLFDSIIARLTTPLAIIIDRIDCCEARITNSTDPQEIIGFLSQLLKTYAYRVKVIITSADDPPKDKDLTAQLAMSTCLIATRTRPLSREVYRRGMFRPVTFGVDIIYNPTREVRHRNISGLENLYKLRRDVGYSQHFVFWSGRLVPRTARQKMIFHHFDLQDANIDEYGGVIARILHEK
jgi:hypothetical protein